MSAPFASRQEDTHINFLKGVCILGVVSIHFGGSFVRPDIIWSDTFYLGLALNQFFSFAVPVFIFLSGWLLQMAYGTRAIDLKTFYRRRLVKLGIPYLLVTANYFIFFRKTWIIQQLTPENFLPRFLYYGIEPTLYFVPLIFQLYLLFPFLKALDDWLYSPKKGTLCPAIVFIMGLFFLLHVSIGQLAYSGKISYHWLCLRFFGFWIFYFYAGMQFKRMIGSLITTDAKVAFIASASLGLAMILFLWDMYVVTDPTRVGLTYERNMLDFAYSRPEILPYNICVVFGLGILLLRDWKIRVPLVEIMGKFSYHIYVWHIPLLLWIAWENPEIISLCTRYPELIVGMVLFVALLITFIISLTEQRWLTKYRDLALAFLMRLKSIVERC